MSPPHTISASTEHDGALLAGSSGPAQPSRPAAPSVRSAGRRAEASSARQVGFSQPTTASQPPPASTAPDGANGAFADRRPRGAASQQREVLHPTCWASAASETARRAPHLPQQRRRGTCAICAVRHKAPAPSFRTVLLPPHLAKLSDDISAGQDPGQARIGFWAVRGSGIRCKVQDRVEVRGVEFKRGAGRDVTHQAGEPCCNTTFLHDTTRT